VKVVWMPAAQRARAAAIAHIKRDDPGAALNQLDEIERQTDRLAEHPDLGRPAPQAGARRLGIARTPFMIVYRIRPRVQRIEIFRFIHTSQNWQG